MICICYCDCGGAICSYKRIVVDCGSCADRRDVVIDAAVLNVEFQVGTNAQQILVTQRDPIPQRTAYAQECIARKRSPTTNLLRVALTKANLVAIVVTAFV